MPPPHQWLWIWINDFHWIYFSVLSKFKRRKKDKHNVNKTNFRFNSIRFDWTSIKKWTVLERFQNPKTENKCIQLNKCITIIFASYIALHRFIAPSLCLCSSCRPLTSLIHRTVMILSAKSTASHTKQQNFCANNGIKWKKYIYIKKWKIFMYMLNINTIWMKSK